jgi:conjugative transfer signal peptidase TraF
MLGRFFRAIDQGTARQKMLCLILVATVPVGIMFAVGTSGLRLNATPSVPTGLYWITSDPRAEFVEFCPPEPFATLSIEREYRVRSLRGCRDGGVPLLKTIVARAGDRVELSSRGIYVNGLRVPNTAPKSQDIAGRPLLHWPFGRYEVAPGTVWVASSFNSRSFDSRYFGPIFVADIKHHLDAIWTE